MNVSDNKKTTETTIAIRVAITKTMSTLKLKRHR